MKSQTATEYLIILAVVIVISLITIGVLGGVPSIGGGTLKNTKSSELKTDKIGVDAFFVNSNYAKLKLRNNDEHTLSIIAISIDGNECDSITLPLILKMGESIIIDCDGTFTDHSGGRTAPQIGFKYMNINDGALYETFYYTQSTYHDYSFQISRVNNLAGTSVDQSFDIIHFDDLVLGVGYSSSDLSSFPGGSTNSGNDDFFLAKLDETSLEYEKINYFGGALDDSFKELYVDKNHIYALGISDSDLSSFPGGSTNSGGDDVVLAKFDKNTLELIDMNHFGGTLDENILDLISYDNYLIGLINSKSDLSSFPGGSTNSGNNDVAIMKFDKQTLEIVDMNYFGGTLNDYLYDIIETRNYFIAVGKSESNLTDYQGGSLNQGSYDFLLAKFNKENLNFIELKNFGESLSDGFNGIINSKYYLTVVGSSYSDLSSYPDGTTNKGSSDAVIMKIGEHNFDIIDIDYFGGSSLDFFRIVSDNDNFIYTVGGTQSDLRSYPGGSVSQSDDLFMVKYNKSNLDVINVTAFNAVGGEIPSNIYISDNHIYVSGFTFSDLSSFPGGSVNNGVIDFLFLQFD